MICFPPMNQMAGFFFLGEGSEGRNERVSYKSHKGYRRGQQMTGGFGLKDCERESFKYSASYHDQGRICFERRAQRIRGEDVRKNGRRASGILWYLIFTIGGCMPSPLID